MPPTKQACRREALAARRALDPQQRADGDRARDAVLAPLLARARTVASYEAFGTEPVAPVPAGALVPVLLPDRDLAWRTAGSGSGGPERRVEEADLLLVPALRVDRRGVRLGRGGGSYDRALAGATGLVVALLHEGELVEEVPREPHDALVHAVALPSGLVHLSGSIGA